MWQFLVLCSVRRGRNHDLFPTEEAGIQRKSTRTEEGDGDEDGGGLDGNKLRAQESPRRANTKNCETQTLQTGQGAKNGGQKTYQQEYACGRQQNSSHERDCGQLRTRIEREQALGSQGEAGHYAQDQESNSR
jgi:hypothetical protein